MAKSTVKWADWMREHGPSVVPSGTMGKPIGDEVFEMLHWAREQPGDRFPPIVARFFATGGHGTLAVKLIYPDWAHRKARQENVAKARAVAKTGGYENYSGNPNGRPPMSFDTAMARFKARRADADRKLDALLADLTVAEPSDLDAMSSELLSLANSWKTLTKKVKGL